MFQTQLKALQKDHGKFSPVHTHSNARKFTRHINIHRVGQIDRDIQFLQDFSHTYTQNTRAHTHTHSTLNSIYPVKLPKLLFLILPFKSKARGVIHNLRIFSFLLPNANGNPCSTNGLLNGSQTKLLLLIGFLLKAEREFHLLLTPQMILRCSNFSPYRKVILMHREESSKEGDTSHLTCHNYKVHY